MNGSFLFTIYSLCISLGIMLLFLLSKKDAFPAVQSLRAVVILGIIYDALEWCVFTLPDTFITDYFIFAYILNTFYAGMFIAILFSSFAFLCKNMTCELNYPKTVYRGFHLLSAIAAIVYLSCYNSGLTVSRSTDPAIRFARGPLDAIWTILSYGFALFAIVVFLTAYLKKENYAHRKSIRPGFISAGIVIISTVIQSLAMGSTKYLSAAMTMVIIYYYIETLQGQISNDMLTGIGNRQQFHFELVDRMSEANPRKRLFVILMDLDRFKEINDMFGHNEGDRALEKFSDILKICCRDSDAKPFRYGGDEFAIIKDVRIEYSSLAADAVQQFVNKIDDALTDYNHKSLKPYDLRASIGYAEYRFEENEAIPDLVARADEMLYHYKKTYHKANR